MRRLRFLQKHDTIVETISSGILPRKIALLQRFVAKWAVEIDESAADVNGDGDINARDIALLQRFVAGWDVELK